MKTVKFRALIAAFSMLAVCCIIPTSADAGPLRKAARALTAPVRKVIQRHREHRYRVSPDTVSGDCKCGTSCPCK